MTKRILIASLAASLAAFGLVACGGEEEEVTPTAAAEPTETAEEPAAEEPAAEEPAADEGSASGDVCERARSCCTDYVAAMPSSAAVNADTACAGVAQLNGPASAAACQAAIDGWRQGLTAMNADIPSSCAE